MNFFPKSIATAYQQRLAEQLELVGGSQWIDAFEQKISEALAEERFHQRLNGAVAVASAVGIAAAQAVHPWLRDGLVNDMVNAAKLLLDYGGPSAAVLFGLNTFRVHQMTKALDDAERAAGPSLSQVAEVVEKAVTTPARMRALGEAREALESCSGRDPLGVCDVLRCVERSMGTQAALELVGVLPQDIRGNPFVRATVRGIEEDDQEIKDRQFVAHRDPGDAPRL